MKMFPFKIRQKKCFLILLITICLSLTIYWCYQPEETKLPKLVDYERPDPINYKSVDEAETLRQKSTSYLNDYKAIAFSTDGLCYGSNNIFGVPNADATRLCTNDYYSLSRKMACNAHYFKTKNFWNFDEDLINRFGCKLTIFDMKGKLRVPNHLPKEFFRMVKLKNYESNGTDSQISYSELQEHLAETDKLIDLTKIDNADLNMWLSIQRGVEEGSFIMVKQMSISSTIKKSLVNDLPIITKALNSLRQMGLKQWTFSIEQCSDGFEYCVKIPPYEFNFDNNNDIYNIEHQFVNVKIEDIIAKQRKYEIVPGISKPPNYQT